MVPAGVTLRGPSVLTLGNESVVLQTSAGLTTSLENVRIESDRLAVLTEGDGTARVDGVTIEPNRGVGIALGSATSEVLRSEIRGNVTRANRDDPRWLNVRASDDATHGVVVSRGQVTLRMVTILGFASVGLALGIGLAGMESGPLQAELSDSRVGEGLGIGIAARGESLIMENVSVSDIWSGVRGWPSYAVLLDGPSTSSNQLRIQQVDGYGLVALAGDGMHAGLSVEQTGDVGVWVGRSVQMTIMGPDARIVNTGFAGLLAVDAAMVRMDNVTIDTVRAERRTVGVRGAIEVGDGLNLFGTPFVLSNLAILRASRIGVLLDSAQRVDASTLFDVEITSEGAGLGAVLGSIDRSREEVASASRPGWDARVTRMGTATANDAAFTGSLPVALATQPPSAVDARGVIAPMY